MSFLGTLIKPRDGTAGSKTPDTIVNPPIRSPAFLFRQPIAYKVPSLPDEETVKYERGTLLERAPMQVVPLRNSLFQPMERGPIHYVFTREWYWRHPQAQSDTTFPSGHVLVADGSLKQLPGASSMVPRSRLTFNLRTPAWSTSDIKSAEGSNAGT